MDTDIFKGMTRFERMVWRVVWAAGWACGYITHKFNLRRSK